MPADAPVPAPVQPQERLSHIDAVRGYALLGVLLMNLQYWFRNPPQLYWTNPHPFPGAWNALVDDLLKFGFDGKSISLFSTLFGVGLCIQRERAEARGTAWGGYAFRRLAAMLAFGALHVVLLWNGDVLHVYALVGFAFLAFLGRERRTLALWAGALLLLNLAVEAAPLVGQALRGPQALVPPAARLAELQAWVDACLRGYAQASWTAVMRFRLWDYGRLAATPDMLGFLLWTLSNFLIGGWLWKEGTLRDPGAHRGRVGRFALLCLAAGLLAAVPLTFRRPVREFVQGHWGWAHRGLPLLALARAWGHQLLALGIGGGLVWLWTGPARRWLEPFTWVGRMAFTNYILQSIVCTAIFCGWGLGLYGHVGPAAGTAFGLGLYLLQVPFSRWWLRRFHFGPLEWLWRSLTYGTAQPFRRRLEAEPEAASA